jgi:hypothetical protein
VVEDYVDKMPLPFTGTLKKFVVILEPEKLTKPRCDLSDNTYTGPGGSKRD